MTATSNQDNDHTRVLNLYAGVGGNRHRWTGVDVTAVEINEEIAAEYQRLHPEDHVVVADAHEFLKDHYDAGWDFIWSSPPCQSHSRISYANWHSDAPHNRERDPEYPDMRLYQEVVFLQHFFDGDWVIENVDPYYDELLEAQHVGRHLFWSNYYIPEFEPPERGFNFSSGEMSNRKKLAEWLGLELSGNIYIGESHDPAQALRNAVHPALGDHVFSARDGSEQATISEVVR